MGGYQRAHKVISARVEDLLIGGRVVAFVEHQRNRLAVAGQRLITRGEFFQHLGKGEAIVLIAGVDLPQQRHVKIHAHQQSASPTMRKSVRLLLA